MILELKVIPNAPKNEMIRWEGNRLVLKIQGTPEKGKVNDAVIAFLAKTFGITQSLITIRSEKASRFKKLDIQGISIETIRKIVS